MTKTEYRYIVQENERDEHGDVADLTVFKTLKEAIGYAFYMKRLNGDKYKISIMFVEKNESNFEPEELNSEDFDWKNFFDPTVVWEGDEAKTCDFCGRVSTPERVVTDFNGWELCPDCWLTDPRALNRPRKEISIDNGLTFIEPEEAIKGKDWDVIAHYMEDEAREKVHNEMAPCADLAFLIRYLELAEHDLVIG